MTMANKWFDDRNKKLRDEILKLLPQLGKLIIVGCNQETIDHNKDNLAIKCIGFLKDREALAALYRTSDVFLNVTHVDTLPTVNMEAACCGIPVVTYDSGGAGELVWDTQTGYVVKPNDINGIIQSLLKVRDGLISKETCYDWASKSFDRNIAYSRYIDLYSDIFNIGDDAKSKS